MNSAELTMNPAWKKYWQMQAHYLVRLPMSLAIALLFFLVQLPEVPGDQRWTQFWLDLQFGFNVWLALQLTFSALYAWLTYRSIQDGFFTHPKTWVNFLVSIAAIGVGIQISLKVIQGVTGRESGFSSFMVNFLIGAFISAAFVFFYGYRESRRENLQLKAAQAEARVHVLENQMQPHFLFNSLNSLSELIRENPERASGMAQKLSDLYREILENSKQRTSSLESEISIVTRYLELEKIRFGDRLQFTIRNNARSQSVQIPSLVLQTLVENSLKHGIARSIEGGWVEVHIDPSKDGSKIRVSNSAAEMPKFSSSGTGLQNTRMRLELLYGDAHHFTLEHAEGFTHAHFVVPAEAST